MMGERRLFSRRPLLLLLAALFVAVAPGLAGAAWDGTQDIRLGDKLQAIFQVGDTSHHVYSFYAPKGTVLDAKAKIAKGSDLVLGFRLFNPLTEVDLGTTDSALGVVKFTIPADDEYALRVFRVSGSGAYSVQTKGKFPSKLSATVALTANPGTGEYTFGAAGGTLVGAKVKIAKGSTAIPTLQTLVCPDAVVPIVAGPSIAKIPVPHGHEYTLGLGNTGPAGDALLSVSLKAPKSKDIWSFGWVEEPVGSNPEIRADWLASGHADTTSEAFRHWDEDGAVSTSCAKCHSSTGYQDFVADGDVDLEAPLGTTVDCEACHNDDAAALTSVTFPSGLSVTGMDASARCAQCHQGRQSTKSMDDMITLSTLTVDEVATGTVPSGSTGAEDKLSFKNIHYFAAAATLFGNESKGGYQYAGKVYPDRFVHVESYDSCVECHDQHSLEVRGDACVECHTGTDYDSYRMTRSTFDYDADGDKVEGIKGELDTLATRLYSVIREYSVAATTKAIVYDPNASSYWYEDVNANGVHESTEGSFKSYTPRLVRACYNYHYYKKDPGAFAHNSRYVMALLYDSLADLDSYVPAAGPDTVVVADMVELVRNDHNHFDYTAQAWHYSYFYPEVRAGCGRCHSPDGFKFYAEFVSKTTSIDNPNVIKETYNGMNCESCHVTGADFGNDPALRSVKAVWFPSGKMYENSVATPDPSFTCLTCHQGREAKKTVDEMITLSTLTDDAVATGKVGSGLKGEPNKLTAKNPHYLTAGAMLYGADAEVGYQYPTKTYQTKWVHFSAANTQCTYCHLQNHSFKPELTDGSDGTTGCTLCHTAGTLEEQRLNNTTNYDGDAATVTLEEELESFSERLYEAIQDYAATHGGAIVYDGAAHPYWFGDTDADGIRDATETEYVAFTPRLIRASFNFKFVHTDPGAWAHNTKYVLQLMFDSIDDLGGDTTGLTRP